MIKKSTNKSSVIELFNILNEGPKEKNKILEHLKIKTPTFYKNIQKLKQAGFKINKAKNLYSIEKYKNILKIDNNEKSAIAYMLYIALRYLPKYKYNKFKKFVKKFLLLAFEKDFYEVEETFELIKKHSLIEEYEEKINILDKYIKNKKRAKITLNSNRIIILNPIGFDWKKDKLVLYYKDQYNNQEKLNIEQIAKIENYNVNANFQQEEEVIFELYESLAKRYLLKQDERVIKNKKDSIIIASKITDKEALFKRLLRYDTLCKILFPEKEVNEFNKLIDAAIINIDSEE